MCRFNALQWFGYEVLPTQIRFQLKQKTTKAMLYSRFYVALDYMWILKAFLRFLALVGLITIIPYAIWWVFTGLNWYDTLDEIEWLD